MKRLRLGVIGCGDITKYTLLMAKLNRKIQIAACADKQIERAQKYAKHFRGAKAFSDYTEMISSTELDAVYLAVPHFLHYPIMLDLLDHNLNILCEKPITTNIEDAKDIIQKAEEKNLKVGVNYQYRYDKACYRMVMAARNNELGELYYGICNIPWHRTEDYFNNSPWHKSLKQSGGGTLLTQGSHALDILLWAFNSKPNKVNITTKNYKFKDIEVEDTAIGYIELENNKLISITSSMANAKEQPITIDLYGEKGSLHYSSNTNLKIHKAKIKHYRPTSKGIHALARSLNAYTDWILNNTPYLCTARDSLPVLDCIVGMYKDEKSES